MVLGLKSKNRKGISVQVDYLIHVHEIKPWPPSQSSRSAQAVLLHWENGDQSSGSFNSGVGDGKIEFSHSFRLPVTFHREASKKSTTRDSLQKNCLEFYFYESLRDKAVRGQQLGSAIINLAAYGIVQESITISTPINCKKGSKSTVQAVLYVSVQPFDKYSSSSSPNESLLKQVSLETDGSGSVLKLMNEDNGEEEIASFTDYDDDDDVSSHSSRTTTAFETTGGSHRNGKNQLESEKDSTGRLKGELSLPLEVAPVKSQVKTEDKAVKQLNGSLSSTVHISDLGSHVLNPVSKSEFSNKSLTSILEKSVTHSVQSSSSYLGSQDRHGESDNYKTSFQQRTMAHDYHEKASRGSGRNQENAQQSSRNNITGFASSYMNVQAGMNSNLASCTVSQANQEDERNARRLNKNDQDEARTINLNDGLLKDRKKKEQPENGQEEQILETKNLSSEEVAFISSQDAARKQVRLRSDAQTFSRKELGVQGSIVRNDRLKHLKSVQLHFDSTKGNELFSNTQFTRKVKDIDIPKDADIDPMNYARSETKEQTKGFSDSKVELESKIEMLEEELREAAAIEVGLYSVVAEHGSSVNKVHAPARRLSRLYFHACKAKSPAKRASAARTAISGLVLVSKACGNDVPRLTFWLSNSIVFRAIVCQAVGKLQLSTGPCINSKDGGKGSDKKSSLKCHESSPNDVGISNAAECFDDWEDPQTFIMTLEKVEGWIFSRIVESVWWQTLTPHMQSAAAKGSNSRKTYGRRSSLGDPEQGNFSIDLWKKAFKDACERLCPIRAGGHECGCLPVLSRLVMEQLVCRLDVAMFNAVLRESDEEMPTDPVSDPISDPKVLPIPAGKSSFGAGAQLKNAIGNWSRWLTDLFGIDDNDSPGDKNELGHEKRLESETSFKTFHLLNALSDLMMLPFEMLADRSTRKEVCPTLDAALIKRVVNNFVPDEFCPNPIPEIVFEALDSEDLIETKEDSITSFPCIATPTVYSPPPAASLMSIIGEVGSQTPARSGSSVLRKSYTSDDELDEVDSPITSIIGSSTTPKSAPKGKGGRKIVRYQLLRQVWKNSE